MDLDALRARLKKEAAPGLRKQLREDMKRAQDLKNRI